MSNIIYVSPYFWPETIGSAPYCSTLADHLAATGHDVHVLAMRPFYPKPDDFSSWADGHRDHEKVKDLEIARAPFNPAPSAGFKNRLLNDMRFAWHVLRQGINRRAQKADHVIVYVPSIIGACGAWGLSILKRAKFSIIVHDIESGLANALGLMGNSLAVKVLRSIESIILNRADQIIVLTEGMKSELHGIGCKSHIDVIPIWSMTFPDVAIATSGPLTIGYSGNFGRKQNLDQLIPILKSLEQSGIEIAIHLRGDGSEKERLQTLVHDLKLSHVKFLPLAPEEQLQQALQEIDLHLVPQALGVANYALPSKLITLMGAGRAFISIAEPGSALDVIARESEAGLCFAPGHDEAVVAAILDLAKDRSRLAVMGENGRKFVMARMNSETLLPVYAATLGLAGPARTEL